MLHLGLECRVIELGCGDEAEGGLGSEVPSLTVVLPRGMNTADRLAVR
jgi:hypothetical protein